MYRKLLDDASDTTVSKEQEYNLLRLSFVIDRYSPYITIDEKIGNWLLSKKIHGMKDYSLSHLDLYTTSIDDRSKASLRSIGKSEIFKKRTFLYEPDAIYSENIEKIQISDKRLFLIRSDIICLNDVIKIYKKYEDGIFIQDFLDRNKVFNIKIEFSNQISKMQLIDILIKGNRQEIYENRKWIMYYFSKYSYGRRNVDFGKHFVTVLNSDNYSDSDLIKFAELFENLIYLVQNFKDLMKISRENVDIMIKCTIEASESFAIEYILDTIPGHAPSIVSRDIDEKFQDKLENIPRELMTENDKRIIEIFFQGFLPKLSLNLIDISSPFIDGDINRIINNAKLLIMNIQELSKISLVPILIKYKNNGFITIKRKFPILSEKYRKLIYSRMSEFYSTEVYRNAPQLPRINGFETIDSQQKRSIGNVPIKNYFVSKTGAVEIFNPRIYYYTSNKDENVIKSYFIGGRAVVLGKEKRFWRFLIKSCSVKEYSKLYGDPIPASKEDIFLFTTTTLPTKKRLMDILIDENVEEILANRRAYKIYLIKYYTLTNFNLSDYGAYRLLKNGELNDKNHLSKFTQLFQRILNKDFIPENIIDIPIEDRIPIILQQYEKNKQYDIAWWQGIV